LYVEPGATGFRGRFATHEIADGGEPMAICGLVTYDS